MPLPSPLPLILAGPILRRVDASQVTVWMALSQQRSGQLGIWAGAIDTDIGVIEQPFRFPNAMHISAPCTSIRIGEKLHILVVHLPLPGGAGLTPAQVFSYNVVLSGGTGGDEDFRSLGLLKDKNEAPKRLALGYDELFLPTFATAPAALNQLNILHASCRKAHGVGEDALAALDSLITKAGMDAIKRPHQIFLTGDQIYADEVGLALLPMLTEAGQTLLGIPEHLKVNGVDTAATIQNFPSGRRQKLSNKTAKFTSGAARSHIMSFGEFCAMYLFYWSTSLWSALPADEDAVDIAFNELIAGYADPPVSPELLSNYPTDPDELDELKESFSKEVDNLKAFLASLPKAMRVLANIPCQMVYDDHEVTDDWYITKKFRDEVHASSLGKNIVRNALLAYVLFQDWGNVPSRYGSGVYANVLAAGQQYFPSGSVVGPVQGAAETLDNLFSLNPNQPAIRWDYVVPSGPTQTVVLDTRTRRIFAGELTPPGLMSEGAMTDQLPPSLAPSAGAEVLLVVSPVPVLGLALMEELFQPVATAAMDGIPGMINIFKGKKTERKGYARMDLEAWAYNPPVFEALLGKLFPYKKVVILSGDVHYGFTSAMDYWKKGDSVPTRIVQVTASPSRNEEDGWMEFPVTSGLVQQLFSRSFIPVERMAWSSASALIGEVNVPNGGPSPVLRSQLRQSPVLLHPRTLPEGTTVNVPSDWSWRLLTLVDQRPDDSSPGARPKDGQAKPIANDLDPAQAGAAYAQVMIRHDDSLRKRIVRRMVWHAQFGWVKFSGTGNTLKVRHEIRYVHPDGAKPNDPDAYTVHEASLAPSTDPKPSIGGTE